MGNCASQKECENGDNDNDQKIYASMAWMSDNDEITSRDFGDSSQLTNWIWDSGATCHIPPQVSDFIPGSLEDTDKHIEVADGHHVTAKQKVQIQIKMCNYNGDLFIATVQNVLLAPDLCDMLFSIITLINLGHIFYFTKVFYGVLWWQRENAVTLPRSAQQKHEFWGEIKQMPKTKKIAHMKNIAL